jgi:hypothetical protein
MPRKDKLAVFDRCLNFPLEAHQDRQSIVHPKPLNILSLHQREQIEILIGSLKLFEQRLIHGAIAIGFSMVRLEPCLNATILPIEP